MKRFLKLMAALVAVILSTGCTDEAEMIADQVDPTFWPKKEYFLNHWSEYLVPGSWAFLLLALLVYHYISLPGKKARSLKGIPFWFVVAYGLSLALFHCADESLGWLIPLMLIGVIRFQPPELTSLAEKKGWKALLTLRYWPKKPPEAGSAPTPPAQPGAPTAPPPATAPSDPASTCPNCGGYLGPKTCTAGCGYRRPATLPATPAPDSLTDALDLDEYG